MNINKSFYGFLFLAVSLLLSLVAVNATPNVIDVQINENVFEEVLYNPLKTGVGTFFDANENQSVYSLNGTIVIKNNHPVESVGNLLVRIDNISNIYNVSFLSGRNGFVQMNISGNYMILSIPDLSAGQNTTFSYDVNSTNVAPPLNFTSSYDKIKIFTGLTLGVTDTIANTLNASQYADTCIYNLNITQNALTIVQGSGNLNFTFDNSTVGGLDSSNATFSANNRTIAWNVWNNNCFSASNSTNLSYGVVTPTGVEIANNYKLVNTTIKYSLNNSFSLGTFKSVSAFVDNDINFQKYLKTILTGDNATWKITANVSNPTNISVNLTEVTLWVSQRNGTGTGFTNPSKIDNDTISGVQLLKTFNPNIIINNTIVPWTTGNTEWFFNYTFSSSPIVWMDIKHNIISDGVQITNRSVSKSENSIYIKEIYLATGYWLQIFKNITKLGDNNYSVYIKVENLGTSPTPSNQVVQVYNFIPIQFNLTSPFVFSSSPWYTMLEANTTLTDPIYNGTMFQWGLNPNANPSNSSLDKFGGGQTVNNTWSVTFNISGNGQFNFDDLFLTGVDPLNVDGSGSTLAVVVESAYSAVTQNLDYVLGGAALVIGGLLLLL